MDKPIALTNPNFTPSEWDPFEVKTQHDKIKDAMSPIVAWLNSNTPSAPSGSDLSLSDDTLKSVSDLLISSLDDLLNSSSFNADMPLPERTTNSPLEAIPGAIRSLVNPDVIKGIKAALHVKLPDLLKEYAKLYKASLQLYKGDDPLKWIQSRHRTIRAVRGAVNRLDAESMHESVLDTLSASFNISSGALGLMSLVVGVLAAPFTAGASLALVVLSLGVSCASAAISLAADTEAESKVNAEMEELRKALRQDASISPEMEKLLTFIAQAWQGIEFSIKDTTSDLFNHYSQVPAEKWAAGGAGDMTNHDVMNAWAVAHSLVITNFLAHLTDAHTPMAEGKRWIGWVVKGGSAAYKGISIPMEVWRAGRVVLDASRLVSVRLSTVTVSAMGDAAQLSRATTAAGEIFAKAALKIAAGEGTIPIIGTQLYKAGSKAAVFLAVLGDIYAIGSGINDLIYATAGMNKLHEAAGQMRTFSSKLIAEYKASCAALAGFAHLRDPGVTNKSTLKKGEVMYSARNGQPDDFLLSPGGWFRLCCQGDGNLCMYRGSEPRGDQCVWATMTMRDPSEGPFRLEFAPTGGLRWMTANGTQLWPPNNGDLMVEFRYNLYGEEYTELQLSDDGNMKLVVLPKQPGLKDIEQPVAWELLISGDNTFIGGCWKWGTVWADDP